MDQNVVMLLTAYRSYTCISFMCSSLRRGLKSGSHRSGHAGQVWYGRLLQCHTVVLLWALSYSHQVSTVRCWFDTQFSPKSSQKTHHSLSVRARYGVPFVCINFDLCSTPFTATMPAASCYIGPRYNSTVLLWRYNTLRRLCVLMAICAEKLLVR